jgi:membrane associated rhomboid family serine protease
VLPLSDGLSARRFPVVNAALIAANIAVWIFYELPDLDGAVAHASFYPCDVENTCQAPLPWVISWITAMFLHGSWDHLLGNMLFLAIFGKNVEDAFGRLRYLAFYVAGGFAATALQTVMTLGFGADAEARVPMLGASGAISAVLGAYFVLLPRASVLTAIFLGFIFFLREIPAFFFLGIYFLFQAFQANFQLQQPPEGGGVAVFAHIGGIVFGLATVKLFEKHEPLRPR